MAQKVGDGMCQPHEGLVFWDLKPLDASASTDFKKVGDSNNYFAFKLCETKFKSSELKLKGYETDKDVVR